ncbi:MAG: hypothetical protein ACI3W5_02630 [Faecousia sp.]
MKKIIVFLMSIALVLSCSVLMVAACENGETEGHIDINLDEMEVGEVVYLGDLAFEKAPENASIGPITRATTEGFSVSNFGGNTSMNKVLTLNSSYRYFRILVNNEGSGKIKVDIGGRYTTSISPGSMYIYSTESWPAQSYTVSFSCDTGLYGSAQAILCSTLAEATP